MNTCYIWYTFDTEHLWFVKQDNCDWGALNNHINTAIKTHMQNIYSVQISFLTDNKYLCGIDKYKVGNTWNGTFNSWTRLINRKVIFSGQWLRHLHEFQRGVMVSNSMLRGTVIIMCVLLICAPTVKRFFSLRTNNKLFYWMR